MGQGPSHLIFFWRYLGPDTQGDMALAVRGATKPHHRGLHAVLSLTSLTDVVEAQLSGKIWVYLYPLTSPSGGVKSGTGGHSPAELQWH